MRNARSNEPNRQAFRTYLLANLADQIKTYGHARIHLKGVTNFDLLIVKRLAKLYGYSVQVVTQSNGDATYEAYIHIRQLNQMKIVLTDVTPHELELTDRFIRKYGKHFEVTREEEKDGTHNICLQLKQKNSSRNLWHNSMARLFELVTRIANTHQLHAEIIQEGTNSESLETYVKISRLGFAKMYAHGYISVYEQLEKVVQSRTSKTLHQPIIIPFPFRNRAIVHRLVEKLRQRNHDVHPIRGAFNQYSLHFPKGVQSILH